MIDTSRMSFLSQRGLGILREATVSVVGAGGGGSHVAQQLAHLAIGIVYVIDHDRLDASNVNRVVGATYRDVGGMKAAVLAARFSGLGGAIVPIAERAEHCHAARAIESSDIVVGAVDSFRARHNLEKKCRAALVPYVDIGLTIIVDELGRAAAIGGQVVTSLPNGPCLECVGVATPARLAGDREEYVAGAPEQQVVSMNGLLASQAVNTTLALLTDYGGSHRPPMYLAYDGLRHELRRHPLFPETAACPHYPVAEAGHRYVLPPRRANVERAI